MYRQKGFNVYSAVFAVIVCVLATSIIWAAYSSTLKVSGSATIQRGSWSVTLADTTEGTPEITKTGSASIMSNPVIGELNSVSSTKISNLVVSMWDAGDTVTYKFLIKNNGTFPARLNTYTLNKNCTNAENSTTTITDANLTTICSGVSVTMKYADGSTVASSTTRKIAGGASETVTLTVSYDTVETELLTDDVKVSIGADFDFVQA